jgi:hypothetical protein
MPAAKRLLPALVLAFEVLLSAAPVGAGAAAVLTARTGGSGGSRTSAGSSIGAGAPTGGSAPGPAILTRAPG